MKRSTVILAAAATLLCLDVFSQGKPPPRPKRVRLPIEVRSAAIGPAATGELRLVPTFNCVSVAWGAAGEVPGLALEWRRGGGEWRRMEFGCVWFDDVKNYRGSVYGLDEDTEYEVRLVAGGKTLAAGAVRTWAGEVPIARTVEIDPATARYPIVISDKGTADGWVRYTVKGGGVLRSTTSAPVFIFTNAAYVVIDDATIRGGRGQSAISVDDGHHLRIRNCDIADWGVDNVKPRYDSKGGLFGGWDEKKRRYAHGNHSGGIDIASGASAVVVERCWIHDAHSRAHSWRYSHPYGPMAIRLRDSGGNVVLRWNDIVGSDFHRWDDGIGGGNDFYEKGTFNRDSDVNGNFIVYANDDALEIDGGQQNVRVFGNRMEGSFMGASVQGAVVSPSYVFDNVFSGCCEEFDATGTSIKLSGIDVYGYGPSCFIFGNIMWGRGGALYPGRTEARIVVRRNVCFGPWQTVTSVPSSAPYFDFAADNVTNAPSSQCPAAGNWPRRPIPYVLDTARIDGVKVADGVAAPKSVQVKLSCGGAGYRSPFRICKNDDMDWFAVSPESGVVESGGEMVFTVTFDAGRMSARRLWRGAFLVRTADGFSRPVTLYAETDHVPPFRAEKPGETAIYAKVDPANPFGTYTFDVPKDGRYYFMMRARHNVRIRGETVSVKIDGDDADFSTLQNHLWPTWMILAPGGTYMSWIRYYDLKAGPHTLVLAPGNGEPVIEGLVLTDSPGSFEPQ